MASEIRIDPELLRAQASELQSLSEEYEELFSSVTNELGSTNSNWSSFLANNFLLKISLSKKSFNGLVSNLELGSKSATEAANNFESIDKALFKNGISSVTDVVSTDIKDGFWDNLSEEFESAREAIAWFEKQYGELDEGVKAMLEKLYNETFSSEHRTAFSVTKQIIEGDYIGAYTDFRKQITSIMGKELGKGNELTGMFYTNMLDNAIETYAEYFENPNLETFTNMFFESTVGSTLKTGADYAWDKVVSKIPIISDYYTSRGASSGGEAINLAYSDWVGAIFGDDAGEYAKNYYSDNGGLWGGLVNGVKTISEEVNKDGGLIQCWINGWKSIF